MRNDTKTLAYVLRRTNYGEADRILNLITPNGKISAIAKAARKEKSKLAGGIEMFSLIELNIHQGRGEIGVVTSARMLKYYDKLLADYARMELASFILKKINQAAEGSDSEELFKITDQSLAGLNKGMDLKLVESWFLINLLKNMGEEINLYRDLDGDKLDANLHYDWDGIEQAFIKNEHGDFGANEIKLLRLMSTAGLTVVNRIKDIETMLPTIEKVVKFKNKY
ncbi:DNA repair protein RecO [Candidatus Saccharibacteria bacterium]|nr:DNA repair protein RecO [Candidatus Saccharibacteria bacterium]